MLQVPGSTNLDPTVVSISRGFFSCCNKDDPLLRFVWYLHNRGVEIVSSSGTADFLIAAGIPVSNVVDITGWKPMFDKRYSTMHPLINGAMLGDWRKPKHLEEAHQHGIVPIDLVCVDVYPFIKALEEGLTPDEMVENIDCGGPNAVRCAGKNFANCAVVCNPEHYFFVTNDIKNHGGLTTKTRLLLAKEAFRATSEYDRCVANWMEVQFHKLPED